MHGLYQWSYYSCSYLCVGPSSLPTTIIPQTLLHSAHSELIEAKSESGRLVRELRGRTLQVRSLEVQQGKCTTHQDDTARELGILRAQLVHTVLDSPPINLQSLFFLLECLNSLSKISETHSSIDAMSGLFV